MLDSTATRAKAHIDKTTRPARPGRVRAPKTPDDTAAAARSPRTRRAPKGELVQAVIAELASGGTRKILGSVAALVRAIEEVGYLDPILIDRDKRIIDGHRRVQAAKELGWTRIPAVILDVQDPLLASVSLGAHRKRLTATERYALFEELLARCADRGYRETVLGGRLARVTKRRRLDEAIGAHVGLSRESLRKIRLILDSAREDEGRFGDLAVSLDADGRVDRHYRELGRRLALGDAEAAKAILLDRRWTELLSAPKALARGVRAANLAGRGEKGCLLLVPAPVALVSAASEILRSAGYCWASTVEGDAETVWLVGLLGRREVIDPTVLELVAEGCAQGADGAALALETALGAVPLRFSLSN